MEPRVTFITLGVDDLERAAAFDRDGLGLATKGIVGSGLENGAAAFFNLRQAERAGTRNVKPAHPTFYGGYAGYFQDPDGHLWEIAFNPGLDSAR